MKKASTVQALVAKRERPRWKQRPPHHGWKFVTLVVPDVLLRDFIKANSVFQHLACPARVCGEDFQGKTSVGEALKKLDRQPKEYLKSLSKPAKGA